MTTRDVPIGSQDFETDGVQLPNADVVHAAGPATDVDQDRPRHWRPREPRVDHWCENHGPYIKGSRLHVLKTIGSYADLTTGIAVVGIETLAKVGQLHPRQVRRIIKDLAHKRFWFVIVERPRGNKLGHSNEYHFSGAATQWTPVRQEINGFETKAEGNIRKLTLALELLRSHGVEIPEELQDNSRGDISACPPNDDDDDNTEGTFINVPSVTTLPAPDFYEHLNGVESSWSSSQDKLDSHATEEDFADAKDVVDATWDVIRQKVNRDTGEITQQGWRDKKHAVDRLAWDREQRETVRDKIPKGRRGYALDPGTAEFQEAKAAARNAARERGDKFDVEAFARGWHTKQRQAVSQ